MGVEGRKQLSNIVSYLNSISSEVSNQNQTIKSRVAKVNQSWEGDAQEGFNDAHQEAIICAEKLESKIKDMKRIAQNYLTVWITINCGQF